MFKRPDSDIFGTKQLNQGIKINNDSFVDPNEAFKRKNDENYTKYINKLGNVGKKNLDGNPQMTKVNQKASFDEEYHKDKKFTDLQSNIFGEQKVSRPKTASQPNPLKEKTNPINQIPHEINYGRKNTLRREVESLPYNNSNLKGNASKLFDFDQSIQKMTNKDQITLIPHQMHWDQHDSIRYNHHKQINQINPLIDQSHVLQKAEQTCSVEDPNQKNQRKQSLVQMKSLQKKQKTNKEQKVSNQVNQQKTPKVKEQQVLNSKIPSKSNEDVEIKVIKGWDNKFLEGLSKYCKLYSTPMIRFELEGAGKAVIYLKKTKKWQAISDWLTKDAKLKIRVSGN